MVTLAVRVIRRPGMAVEDLAVNCVCERLAKDMGSDASQRAATQDTAGCLLAAGYSTLGLP